MESIITTRHEDAAHVNALLKRFATWGMLQYYDMDAVWGNLHATAFRFFFVFYADTMDHRALVKYLEELRGYAPDPLRGLSQMSFYYPHANRLHDIRSLDEVLSRQERP